MKPFWKRTASLLDPPKVLSWATEKRDEGLLATEHFTYYKMAYEIAETFMQNENSEFVKIGFIEDRRSKTRYPGQLVVVTKVLNGQMKAIVFDGTPDGVMVSDPFQYDYEWTPGGNRRLFYGFYDPNRLYAKTQAIAAKEAPYRATESEQLHDPFKDYRSPF